MNTISELSQSELNKEFANNIPKNQNMLYNNTNTYKNSNITSLNNSVTNASVNDASKNASQKNNGIQSATSVKQEKLKTIFGDRQHVKGIILLNGGIEAIVN